MNGLIALLGSGEYLPIMDPIDRVLLESVKADRHTPRVVCLPTAAGTEGEASVQRWMDMGLRHFRQLGADVSALPIIDKASADDPQYESQLEAADLIYFSGGNPLYLFETMHGSRAWTAAQKAWDRGAAYAGCSAGAMILAALVPDVRTAGLRQVEAFNQLPAVSVIPHFDRMQLWRPMILTVLRGRLTGDQYALGIDENTALIGRLNQTWRVMGAGKVYLIDREGTQAHTAGEEFKLPDTTQERK